MAEELDNITLDLALGERLKPVKDTSFRDLVGHGVYLKDAFSYLSRNLEEMSIDVEGYPDAVSYCFVDDEVGICFRCLCAAREVDGKIELLDAFDEITLTMRRATVQDALCAPISNNALATFTTAIAAIDEEHAADDFTQGMRELADLDGLRNPDFPDVIKAVLMEPNAEDGYELVWVKPWATSEDEPQCVLMSEPSREDLGLHEGDTASLAFQQQPDGIIVVAQANNS